MNLHSNKRAARRPTPLSYIVISGENVTIPYAAKKLGMDIKQFATRKRQTIKDLPPGTPLTWKALSRGTLE